MKNVKICSKKTTQTATTYRLTAIALGIISSQLISNHVMAAACDVDKVYQAFDESFTPNTPTASGVARTPHMIFSIDQSGIVREVRYDTSENNSDIITYQNAVTSQLNDWLNINSGSPSAGDISGFLATQQQQAGAYYRQLLANPNAQYALDDDQWLPGAANAWSTNEAVDNDRRFKGTILAGNTASPTILQTIDFSAFNATEIDAGNLRINLGGEFKSPSNHIGRWTYTFYNSVGTQIQSNWNDLSGTNSWLSMDNTIVVPANARSMKVALSIVVPGTSSGKGGMTFVPVNSDTPSYFDNVRAFAFLNGSTGTYIPESNMTTRTHTGSANADTYTTSAASEQVFAGAGDDVITGGAGNDIVYGESGNDTYKIALGGGNDTINNLASDSNTTTDQLVFGGGIVPASLQLSHVGDDLVIAFISSSQTVTVKNYFPKNGTSFLDQIKFIDSTTVWDANTIPVN